MMKYLVMDMTDTQIFDTEKEARKCLADWLEDTRESTKETLALGYPREIEHWKREEDFYAGKDNIDYEIRLYAIDTDVYDGELTKAWDGCEGVERIETVSTTVEALGLEWPTVEEDMTLDE